MNTSKSFYLNTYLVGFASLLLLSSACNNNSTQIENKKEAVSTPIETITPTNNSRISVNPAPIQGQVESLLDGIEATNEITDANWVIFNNKTPISFLIKLPEQQELKSIKIGAFIEQKSNFFQPIQIDYSVAQDEGKFMKVGSQDRQTIPFSGKERRILALQLNGFVKQIRITLTPLDVLPDWVEPTETDSDLLSMKLLLNKKNIEILAKPKALV